MRRKLTPTEVKISENRMKAIKEEIEYHSYIKQYLELELRLGLEQAFKLKLPVGLRHFLGRNI